MSVNGAELVQIEKIAYPHIRSQIFQKPVNTKLLILDSASLENISIGWIDGGADRAYFWASQLGANVTQLDDETLIYGDLEKYDVIVAGVFAGKTRPINLAMDRIRGWIERGVAMLASTHARLITGTLHRVRPYRFNLVVLRFAGELPIRQLRSNFSTPSINCLIIPTKLILLILMVGKRSADSTSLQNGIIFMNHCWQ